MSEQHGYIALHRKLLDNPVVCKDADHLAIWVWLLLKASWKESDVLFNGKRITLKPGELPPISRRTIASELHISDSKVQRVLKSFESEHQIEQRTNRQSRLITIVSWDKYQGSEPPSEPQVNHDRTTSEPRVNTIEESNKGNKGNKGKKNNSNRTFKPPAREEVQAYIDEKGYSVNAERFMDYYIANGWMVGKNHMKDWKAAVRNWERNNDTRRSDKERKGVRGTVREGKGSVRNDTPEWYRPFEAFPLDERSEGDA
jgi:hypothetical protein